MTNSNAIVCVRDKFTLLRSIMDERMCRRWAASEAMSIGWGGIAVVAEALQVTMQAVGFRLEAS